MNFMKKLALRSVSVLALATASGMAIAADVPVKYVPPAPAPCNCDTWSGFYIGAYFGHGAGKATESFATTSSNSQSSIDLVGPPFTDSFSTSTSSTSGSSTSGNITGSVVNLVVGGNWQVTPFWVLGAQVEGTVFSDITLKTIGTQTSRSSSSSFSTVNGVPGLVSTSTSTSTSNYEYHDELRSMFTFIGRAGGLVTPDLLLYVLGGGVLGNFVIPDAFQGGEDSFGGKRSIWKLGYTVGAGGEYRINKNWFLRAEYRYIHFKYDRDASSSSSSTSTSTSSTFNFTSSSTTSRSTDFDFHMGKIGVAYKFCPGCGW